MYKLSLNIPSILYNVLLVKRKTEHYLCLKFILYLCLPILLKYMVLSYSTVTFPIIGPFSGNKPS